MINLRDDRHPELFHREPGYLLERIRLQNALHEIHVVDLLQREKRDPRDQDFLPSVVLQEDTAGPVAFLGLSRVPSGLCERAELESLLSFEKGFLVSAFFPVSVVHRTFDLWNLRQHLTFAASYSLWWSIYLSQEFIALGIIGWIDPLYQTRPLLVDLVPLELAPPLAPVIVLYLLCEHHNVVVELLEMAPGVAWGNYGTFGRFLGLLPPRPLRSERSVSWQHGVGSGLKLTKHRFSYVCEWIFGLQRVALMEKVVG